MTYKRTKRHPWRLTLLFSLAVFVILVFTMVMMGLIMMILYHFNLAIFQSRWIMFLNFAVVSILVGTAFSQLIGRKAVAPVEEISEAAKEVAKGNFDLHINENIRADEIRIMAQNFNLMVRELSNTELFRNDFINNVSHEFKTPLAAIEGYGTLLQNKGVSAEKRELYVEKILYNTRRLSALTGNILMISRLENQEIATEKERFSLDEQIREMILLCEEAWNRKSLYLDVDLDPVDYFGNPELLAQVWQNLISNAVKFSNNGGTVWVRLRRQEAAAVVEIADNGPGMSPQVAARIFEKFYQGESSHSTEGNGLGLALSKRILDLHGGQISVSSKEGKGTTFTVILPCEDISIK